jgi:O-antigen/teichoic acid export membrane protein
MEFTSLFNQVRRNKGIIAEGMWPFGGNILNVILNFFTIKIVTHFITPDNYGKATLVLGIFFLVNSLLFGPLMVAHNRIYFDYLKVSLSYWYQRNIKVIIIKFILVIIIIYSIVSLIYFWQNNSLYLNYILPIFLLAFITPFFTEKTNYLEAHKQQKKLAVLNSIQKLLYPIIIIFFLFLIDDQTIIIIVAQGLSILITVFIFKTPGSIDSSNNPAQNNTPSKKELNQSLLSFGWYLPVGYFIMWLLTTSDRYLIEQFRTINEVGIYALNYGLWSMPFLILNNWLEVWTRPHIYNSASKDDWHTVVKIIRRRIYFASLLCLLIILTYYFLSEFLVNILLNDTYRLSKLFILLIAIAHLFQVIGYSILPIFLAAKKLKTNLIAVFLAATVNIILNIFLIPKFGLLGAALSTMIGYSVWVFILSIGAVMLKKVLLTKVTFDD